MLLLDNTLDHSDRRSSAHLNESPITSPRRSHSNAKLSYPTRSKSNFNAPEKPQTAANLPSSNSKWSAFRNYEPDIAPPEDRFTFKDPSEALQGNARHNDKFSQQQYVSPAQKLANDFLGQQGSVLQQTLQKQNASPSRQGAPGK